MQFNLQYLFTINILIKSLEIKKAGEDSRFMCSIVVGFRPVVSASQKGRKFLQ